MIDKLVPLAQKEVLELLDLKAQETLKIGDERLDQAFTTWDGEQRMLLVLSRLMMQAAYLRRIYKEKFLDLDEQKIKEYFPVDFVVPAVLEKYKKLLQCRFELVPEADVWHQEVITYSVWDACKDNDLNHGFLGYLHLDLFPRKGKFAHAGQIDMVPGFERGDGTRQHPTVAVVANLATPTATMPALLAFDQVVTLFHEVS